MKNIKVIHGPNLNLLGQREPEIYGHETLDQINHRLVEIGNQHQLSVECFQSNAEHELIDFIHQSVGNTDFIIINPAAYTHTSVALRDALVGVNIRFIEVHLSNVHRREPFRHHSYFSDKAEAVIAGLGSFGYDAALLHIASL